MSAARDGVDDFELYRTWVKGDRSAGGQLVERYYGQIQAYFMNRVSDSERHDLAHETFARLLERPARFEQRSSFRTYLFGIAHYVLLEHLRSRRGNLDPLTHSIAELDGVTASHLVEEVAKHYLLLRCIRELPVYEQSLLELRYWHGMKFRECAEVLERPEGALRRELTEVRGRLRRAVLAGRGAPPGASMSESSLDEQLDELANLLFEGPGSQPEGERDALER